MKRFSKGFLILAAACAGLTSCSDESMWSGSSTEGGIQLGLSADGRVMRQTRADDSVSPVVPEEDSFAISLKKSDGSYSKNWSSTSAFNRETSFAIGDYTLEAVSGNAEVEGFELPVFRGVSDVHVSPGELSEVKVVATLANSMVSVRYTDQFKENFKSYSAAVQSEGHDWVVFAQDEDRPAYINPSNIKLNLTLTNEAGDRVTLQPAEFEAKARHHYVVTVGVTGQTETGNLALDVVFDDDVVAETVEVPLGDELWTAPAPTVTAHGFTDAVIEKFDGEAPADRTEFHVFAFGGLRAANLNVISNDYTPAFGRSIQLVDADALAQTQLKSEGVDCAGFFKNVDKMGVVNLTEFITNLPVGSYTIQLEAVDHLTRTSEPAEMKLVVKPVDLELAAPAKADFLSSELTVDLTTNFAAVKDKVTFMAPDETNRMVKVPVKSVTEISTPAAIRTRGEETHTFRYVLSVAPISTAVLDVHATYRKNTADVELEVDVPQFSIETDVFSRYALLKVVPENPSQLAGIVEKLEIYNGSNRILPSNITSNSSTGIITVAGLTPGTTYSSMKAMLGKIEKSIPAFTAEAGTDVTNGDFSAESLKVNIGPIQVGGGYQCGAISKYTIWTSLKYNEANGWASLNELTAYKGSSCMNTWFVVPSTYSKDGEVTVRSVGYSHAGTVPATSGKFASTTYYCTNTPADGNLTKQAGELFLGSYSFNGTANRTDGISHSCRPSSLSFTYRYTSVNNEKAEAYVVIKDASGAVLAQQNVTLSAAASNTDVTLPLESYPFGKKAAKIEIGFRSTQSGVTPKVNIPTGSALKESGPTTLPVTPYKTTLPDNSYHALATGSELVLDNVKLNYDAPGVAIAKGKARR